MNPQNERKPRRSFGRWLADMPRWKQLLCAAAVLAMVTGAALMLMDTTPPPPTGGGTGNAFVAGAPRTGSGTGSTTAAEPASRGVFRLGFSFVAGFCIGYAVRAALKTAAIVAGLVLLLLFALSYGGVIEVHWQDIDALWNRFADAVAAESKQFQAFVTGSLPAAGLATLGLVAGFKKH